MCARGDGGDGGSTAAKQRNILPSLIVPNALSTLHFFSCLFFQRTPPMQGSKKRFLVYTDLMSPYCNFFTWMGFPFSPWGCSTRALCSSRSCADPSYRTTWRGSTPAPTLQNQPCLWGWGEQIFPPSLVTDSTSFPTAKLGTLHGRGRRSTAAAALRRCASPAFRLLSVCFLSCCLFHVLCMIVVLGLISRYAKENKGF